MNFLFTIFAILAIFFVYTTYIKSMKKIIWWASLTIMVVFTVLCYFYLDTHLKSQPKRNEDKATVLVMWHVDTFEGGTGSRQDFLMKSAIAFEKKTPNVYISVVNHTVDSIMDGFTAGTFPDMISFGIGVADVLEYAKPLKTHINNVFFNTATWQNTVYCYPYAYGKYVKISQISPKNNSVVVSKGKNNLPLFTLKKQGGELPVNILPSLESYAEFVAGKHGYMIGTQRDIYRLNSRGYEFEFEPYGDYTDLIQYIAVLSADEQRAIKAKNFAEYLISDEVQLRLNEIGLFSPTGVNIDYGNTKMNNLSKHKIECAMSILIDKQKYEELLNNDGQNDFFEKFLNYVRY